MTKKELARLDFQVTNVVLDGPSLDIGELDVEGFEELGIKLQAIQGHNTFWLGDWGNAFKEQHGRGAVKAVAELLKMDPSYISQCMSASAEYDVETRMRYLGAGLSPTHLILARKAPSAEFALDRASEGEWSTRRFRKEITAMLPKPKDGGRPKAFSWIKDPRIVKGEDGLLGVREAVSALKEATEDRAVAVILLEKWEGYLEDLLNSIRGE